MNDTLYKPLTPTEKTIHLYASPYPGIYTSQANGVIGARPDAVLASGEAKFQDTNQTVFRDKSSSSPYTVTSHKSVGPAIPSTNTNILAVPQVYSSNAVYDATDFPNSLVAQNGLVFTRNPYLSNGYISRVYSVTDFKIFSPYIHYMPSPNGGVGVLDQSSSAFKIDYTGKYQASASVFNLYSRKYRTKDPTMTV